MSYSEQTTHFGWPLPTENDFFNGTDDNEMKEQLDEKIYNLEQAEAGDTQSIADLTQRVTEAEQTIGEYDTRLENVEGAVAEHAERLINLTNRQTELSRRLNGKAGESTIAPEYNPEESYNVGAFVYHNNILYKATAASATPAGDWDANDWRIAILTDELGGSTPTPGEIAAASVTYSDVATQLGANNVQAAIVALKTLIDNIGGNAMPLLDFANPLHTFDNPSSAQSGHGLSFTASKECYLVGTVMTHSTGGSTYSSTTVTIDGTPAYEGVGRESVSGNSIPITKIASGSTVSVDSASPTLHIFDVVS